MTPASDPPAIRCSDLSKRFGPVRALQGVDLEVEAGASLAVLGPNGAGKSTLLRLLAGIAHPSSGSVEVAGLRHSSSNREGARRQVGFVGHATFLSGALTARENLVFAGRLYGVGEPGVRADELLGNLGLLEWSTRRASTLSRGLAQRLAIARALVHDPNLVLLDEPYSGLDRRSADRLTERLDALRARGRTLIVVTHDLRQAVAIATSAIVLAHGRVFHRTAGAPLDRAELDRVVSDAADSLREPA